MAFDDLVGGPDFTANSVLDRVQRSVMSDLPDGANGDMILNRLNRKLIQRQAEPELEYPKTKADSSGPDFSDQGVRADKLPDFSSEGVQVPTPPTYGIGTDPMTAGGSPVPSYGPVGDTVKTAVGTMMPEGNEFAVNPIPSGVIPQQMGAFGSGVLDSVGGVVQGLGTAYSTAKTVPGAGQLSDPMAGSLSPEQIAKQQELDKARFAAAPPVEDNPLVKAGKAIKGAAPHLSDEEAASVTGQVLHGAGAIAPYVATLPLGIFASLGISGIGIATDTYGHVYEEAKKHGAADDVAMSAASRSALVAGVLGSTPLGAGKYAKGLIAKVAASSAAFATAGEAQEAILQQIAKDYDPKAGYTFDQRRLFAEMILGGGVGLLHHAGERKPGEVRIDSTDDRTGAQPSGGLPPPGPNAGPNAGPGAGPGPHPNAGVPPPDAGPNAGPHAGPDTGGPGPKDGMPPNGVAPDFSFTSLKRRKLAEEVVSAINPNADVRSMSDAQLYNAILKDSQTRGNAQSSARKPEEKAAEDAAAAAAGAKRDEDASLKAAFGWMTDAQIQSMTPDMRAVWLKRAAGGKAEAPAEQNQTAPKTEPVDFAKTAENTTTSPNDLTGAGQEKKVGDRIMMRIVNTENGAKTSERFPFTVVKLRPDGSAIVEHPVHGKLTAHADSLLHANFAPEEGPTGRRDSPIKPQTADDVLAAKPTEPKSEAQAAAENYPHAHMELDQFGLTGKRSISVETGVGQDRKGTDPDGKPWSTTMKHGAYGRLKGTLGADGQPLDAFIGPHPSSPHVFVIDQHDPKTGKFDEHKIMLGYITPIDAMHAYVNAYNDGATGRIGHVTAMGPAEFKAWLKRDTTKPLAPIKRPTSSTHKAEEAGQYADTTNDTTYTAPLSTEASIDVPKGSSVPPLAGAAGGTKPAAINTHSGGDTARKPTQGPTQDRDRYVRQRTMNDDREPMTLMQFIASKGGVKPGPELQTLGIDTKLRVQIPGRKGFFSVVREKGANHDVMRRMAQEENYFPRDNEGVSPDRTLTEFYDALANEHNQGQPRRSEGNELHKTKRQSVLDAERDQHERDIDEADYGGARDKIAVDYPDLPRDLRELAARIMVDEDETDVDNAVERAAMRLPTVDDDFDTEPNDIDATLGDGAFDEIHAAATPSDGGDDAPEGTEKPEAGESEEDRSPGERVSDAGKEGRKGQKPAADDTKRADTDTERDTARGGAAAEAGHQPTAKPADDTAVETKTQKRGREQTDKINKREAQREAERRAMEASERQDLEHKLAQLPDGIEAITADYKATIDKFNESMVTGKRDADLADRLDLLETKANGGTRFGVATTESDAEKVRIGAAAPIGTVPKWGQIGVFQTTVGGMNFIVTHDSGLGAGIYAVDKDKPFPSETGFRSMLGTGVDPVGTTVADYWHEAIEKYINEATVKKKGKVQPLQNPETWYRLPDSYEEDGGHPVRVGSTKPPHVRSTPASDFDETVEVSLSAKGPWDFNDTWPKPEPKRIEALEREGRNPFDSTTPDPVVVAEMLDEGMYALMSDINNIRAIDAEIADIRSGKTKLKRNQTVEDAIKPLTKDRLKSAEDIRDAMASHEDVFGEDAARAMVKEARRRLVQEDGQRDKGAKRPRQEPTTEDAAVERFFQYPGEHNDTGLSNDATREQLAEYYDKQAAQFAKPDGSPKSNNPEINAYLIGLNKDYARQARDGEQFDKEKAIRAGNKAQKAFERATAAAEKGADNKDQLVIPGAEKEGQGTQAKRKADAALKPKVAQRPMDVGLFGDEKDQTDLLDIVAKPELSPDDLKAEVLRLADQIEALGEVGAGFAVGMRSAAENNFLRPDSLDFYRKRLAEMKAQSGDQRENPKQDKTLDDLLLGDKAAVTDFRKIMEIGQPAIAAGVLDHAARRYRELVSIINAAGFKINEINSFNAKNAPEVRAAQRLAGEIGGAVLRLLNGLRAAKGEATKRVRGDIEQLNETLGVATLDELKKQLIVIASGMSRAKEIAAGAHAWGGYQNRGIGVDVGELSDAALDLLAERAVDLKAQIFVDSGAFSTFRHNLREQAKADAEAMDLFGTDKPAQFKSMDFDKIMARYDQLEEAYAKHNEVEDYDVPPPMLVMPDIVGDQKASLDLVTKYKDRIAAEAAFNVAKPIVPIQRGELSLAEAYRQIVDTLGTDRFIVGIPSNERAVSNAELKTFIDEVKPRQIHFLGAISPKNIDAKLKIVADANYPVEHISADANILRSALYGKYSGDRTKAIVDLLHARRPIADEQKQRTIEPEDTPDGISVPVHDTDAGAESEAVPEAAGQRGARPAGEPESAGGEPPVSADHGGQAGDLTERAGDRGSGEGDDVRVPGRPEPAEAGRAERADERAARNVKGENYHIEPGALGEDRGPKAKATENVQAIKLANRLIAENRPATASEQHQLARYVGWGGLKNAFPDASGNIAKGFEQVAADLKEILTPEEYDTARRSIQYAHYTSEDIINGMWDIAERLGFKGGHVFEPGMGVGHFAGLMPPDVAARTTYNGVEMDHVTARIAGLLYPRWGVRQADFTKMPLAENTFDLVIGNPPFADISIQSDPKYPQKFLLHDYFFAKSLDAVRPGGLLAFVTSAGTMNKIDPRARDYMADRADFIGGIRLPSNAFKKNAGTEVTTDILILRKRLPDEKPNDLDKIWTGTETMTLPGPDGKPISGNVNAYFAQHPEMVLGKPDFADKLYEGRYSVKAWDNFNLKDALAVAIAKLPRNLMSEAETPQHKAETDFEGTEKKDGSYYLKDGKLFQQRGGAGYEVERRGKGVEGGKTAAELDRIRGLIPVRDALRDTFAADLADDADAGKRARTALNKAYDEFVAKFGPINKAEITRRRPNSIQEESARAEAREEARYAGQDFDEGSFDPSNLMALKKPISDIARARKAAREEQGDKYREGDFKPEEMPDVIIDKRPNIEPFIDDQESYRLRAIEHYDEPTGKAKKRDVFFKNVISKDTTPDIKNVNDAVLHVLNQKGVLDLDAIGALVNKSRSETIEELGPRIYQVPGTKETWETREAYLSGNVRKKLAIAQGAADKNPIYRRNVEALEAAQPAPLAPSQIGASLGMPWIPSDVIEAFGTEGLGLDKLRAKYTPVLATWTVSGDTDSMASTTTWGTARRNAAALLADALNRQNPKVYDQIDKDTRVLNVVATQAAQEKMQAIRDKFNEWIFADEKRADRLAAFYNENYNNLVAQEYNGDHLTTPGIASSWSWRPHQTRVISRIIQSGNTYMAHAVGAGKTSAMIGAGMEMRRLGLVKKPMYAVPNHMLAQFTKEFYEQYPTARIMVADDRQFHTDRRKQFMANVAVSDLDAVIITHSSFAKIPVSDEFSDRMIQDAMDEYRMALAELPAGQENRITRSRIEKQIERLEQRLSGRSTRKRDSVFNFDELGVDFLFVDEAHLFRKLDFSTQMSNLKGITPEGSGMAWDLYTKSKLLNQRSPGRSLVLASGTPVTNTMAELFTVSRYLQPQELVERQLQQFDAWAGAFGENVTELEQNAAGGYKPVSRFAKFVNVAELSSMVRQVMDVVTSRQLEQYVVRPKLKGGKRQMNLADKSPALETYQADLAARMLAIERRKGPPEKGDDIMLTVIGDGRHAAIDMRLVGGKPDANHPSKLDLMVDNIAGIHKATKAQKFYRPKNGAYDMSAPADVGPATQMVFVNLGLSGARGFSVPNYIRSELVRRGIPRDEIAFIADYKNHVAKQKLFNDMNEGKVRVLIGSTAKMATGVNAQRRLYAIHNMDPLWFPSDDEQRNGRGLRQGNMNPEIEIHDYSTKGTYDSTMWGMMAKKARFIQGFFEGDPSLRSMDDLGEASQYEQAKALTTNDPRLMRLTELKQDLEKANRRKAAFDNEQYAVRRRRADANSEIDRYSGREIAIEKDIAQRVPLHGDNFTAKIGRETFTKRVDFGEALLTALDKIAIPANSGRAMPVGEISGFSLVAKPQKIIDEMAVHVDLKRNGGFDSNVTVGASGLGAVRSMESIITGFDHDLAYIRDKIKTARKFLKESEGQDKKKFTGDSDMETLASEIRVLQAELSGPKEGEAPAVLSPENSGLDDDEGRFGQKYVLGMGRHTGVEHMITFDAKGNELERAVGDRNHVEFSPKLLDLLHDPKADVVAHHNHPSGRGFSLQDIAILTLKGLSALWAHGHNGVSYRAAVSEAYNATITATPDLEFARMEKLVKQVDERLYPLFREAFNAGEISHNEADFGLAHFISDVLRQAGILDYTTNYDPSDLLTRVPDLNNAVESTIISAQLEAFGDTDSNRTNRRAKPHRHAGDVGAVFNRIALASTFGVPEPLYPARAENHQGNAGKGITGGLSDRDDIFKKPGSFDRSIGDILRVRFLGKLGRLNMTEARAKVQDKFIRVQKAEESVSAPSDQSAHQAESLYYGITGQRLESLNDHHIDPIVRDMKARNIDLEDMDEFLYARHAVERNAKIAAMHRPGHQFHDAMSDPNIVGGSGMSRQQARDILARLANRLPDFKAVAAKIDALNLKTRRVLLDGGLIDRETFDEMNAAYRWYVPLRGFEGAEYEEGMHQGSGMNIGGKESKAAFGRKSLAASPLAYSIMQAELAIVRAEKNRVGNTFLKFVRANPDPARWTVNRPEIVRRIDKTTGLVTSMPNNLTRYADNVFQTKVYGKPTYITLKGTDGLNLARALKDMGSSSSNALLRSYSTLTHTLAKLATSWNPDFMIPNLIRDLGESFINLSAVEQRKFARNFSSHIMPAIRGSMLAIAGKTPAAGSKMAKYVDAFHRFDAAGGRIRFFGIDDPDQIEADVTKKLKRLDGGPMNTLKDIGDKAAKGMEIAGGGIENATRLASFMAAEQAGFSQADAAAFARNLTVNFNKKGEWGQVISGLYMFANAGIQGIARMAKALTHRRVQIAVATLAGAAALTTMLAIGAGGEDEAGVSHYMKIPTWERDKNLVFMLPKGAYVKVPLPYGFSPFAVTASHAVQVVLGQEKPGKAAGAVIDSILNAFNPLGEEGSIMMDLIPSGLRPFGHITFNQDWTGRPLYPANDPSRGTKPDSSQFFRTNSEFSKEAAKKLNEWSGGSVYTKGVIDVHPGAIDHFLNSYTGGVGRFAKNLVDTMISGIRDYEWNPEKTPVIRRFYGKLGTDADRAAYYEARQPEKDREAGIAAARKDLKAGVNTEQAQKFIHDNATENPQRAIFLHADNQMKILRKQESQITAGDMPSAEKQTKLNEVRQKMREVQNKARAESAKLKAKSPEPAALPKPVYNVTVRPTPPPQ